MNKGQTNFTNVGFANTFILPAVLVFLLPVLSLFFFLHAQDTFDSEFRESAIQHFQQDKNLTAEQREAAKAYFEEHPFSELIANDQIGGNFDTTARFNYLTFRWMTRLAAISIIASVAVLIVAGLCAWASRRSQGAQYLSLSIGWQALRIYGALLTVFQGILLVGLSYWVTALWFHFYAPKLIIIAAALAAAGVGAVLTAIFKKVDTKKTIAGANIGRDHAPLLWNRLDAICATIGTSPPHQLIAGIDDNFFVTETQLEADKTVYSGKTLFVSLALLKQMNGAEAEAVLAHEMAHFSGNDTLYSKKIAPLLLRYSTYLQALYGNPLTRPIFYFMNCFRALFELSLRKHGRQREYRADRIAAETTSAQNMACALLRISAYADFRNKIQKELFEQERILEAANISKQIDKGFQDYAASFVAKPDLGNLKTAHPFDTHPPLCQRFEALGIPLTSPEMQSLVSKPGDSTWYREIDRADEIERQQWQEFEGQFRTYHEQTLAYRLLPKSEEDREIVVKAFPEIKFEGKKGLLVLDCESIQYTSRPGDLAFSHITRCVLKDDTLKIYFGPKGAYLLSIPLKTFGKRKQEALNAFNHYYGRYLNAVAYQKQKQQAAQAEAQ